MNINFESYKIFYFVAKHGNITAAAEALYSEQPNVTRAIKNLERDLGCVLFTRSNKGVTLTPEGVLLAGLVRYHALYPKIKFSLINLTNVQAISAVKNQAVDFALIATPFSPDKTLKTVPIKKFQDVVVCGERYKYLTNEKVSFEELNKHCVISLNKTTKTYEYYSGIFRKEGLVFTPDIEVSTSNQILPIVKNNLGIGFIPQSFAKKEIRDGEVYMLETEKPMPPREVYLIKRNDSSLSVAAKAFEKLLKELNY